MKVPFLNLHTINEEIMSEIQDAANRVLQSGWYILGNEGRAFEKELKTYLVGSGEGYAVGCNSGTDAIVLALLAAGVRAEDEVITVSLTAIPTVSAICEIGARPVFVDIDPDTWVMDTQKIEPLLTDKTKAIVAVHLYGNMVDVFALQGLLEKLKRNDIKIIEDVAQAQGAALHGKQAGTIGDFGCFSFYPSKNIGALGDGGAVFCKDEKSSEQLFMLRNYGQASRYNAKVIQGRNSRLDEIQAAILTVKLKYIDKWLLQKSEQMELYRCQLAALPVKFQEITHNCCPGWHLCVIALPCKNEREKMQEYLQKNGIETLIHYPIPNHCQEAFADYSRNGIEMTEAIANCILSIPLNPALQNQQQQYVIDIIRKYYQERGE